MKTITSLIFILLLSLNSHAQYDKIDSLKQQLSLEISDTAKVRILNRIGSVYAEMKNDSALIFFNNALEISEKNGDTRNELYSRKLTAFYLYSVKSDYASSLELYLKNLKIEEETGDTIYIFGDTRDVTFIYESIEDFQKELEYINKLRYFINSGMYKDSVKSERYRMTLSNRLGGFYSTGKMKNLDSAMFYKRRLFNAGRDMNDDLYMALGSQGIGEVFREMKYSDSAVFYFHICIPIAQKLKRYDIYNICLLSLGNLYLEDKKTDSAFFYGKKVFNNFQNDKNDGGLIEAAALLAGIFFDKGKPDSAYLYLKQSYGLQDSLYSADKLYKIQNLGFNESLQKQKDEQSKKEAVQEYKSKVQIYSLIAGLTFLSFIIFMLYRNNRQRKRAGMEIGKAYEDLKSTQSQLIQSEKMASLGELTAGIAHEIQNPLNFVNNFSEVNSELLSELKDELRKGNMEEVKAIADDLAANEQKINHHGKRADAIVKGMLQHSRSSNGVKEPTDINALADEYLRLSYHGLRAKDKSFNTSMQTAFDESIGNVNVVPQDIGRVILNLITNAFYAVDEKKKQNLNGYEPVVSVSTKKSVGKIEIKVADNGNGIPQKVMDKIFQPFFTTKPTGQGTGLGLSMSYDIIKAHGGELKVETKVGEGAEFIIILKND